MKQTLVHHGPINVTSKARVLVVDDSAMNRRLIARMLEAYGCAATLVTTGNDAVKMLTQQDGHDFDIVLMDIEMPGLNGEEACQMIRAYQATLPGARHVPIVALTASGSPDRITRYVAAGMDAYVAKPIDWVELFSTIDALATKPGGS